MSQPKGRTIGRFGGLNHSTFIALTPPLSQRARELFFRIFMSDLPNCPQCQSSYTYEDGEMYICPECSHEWSKNATTTNEDAKIIKDANGNVLADGDTVTVIKDLKLKGSSLVIKVGTKVKNIRLVDGDHDIDCKVDGIGAMKLKSEFVKKI